MGQNDLTNTMIYLLGFPGTGKYTIAKEIVKQEPAIRLIDNHLINNPLFSLIKQDGTTPLPDRIWRNIGKIWEVVFDTMIHASEPEYSFIMTNALLECNPEDRAWVEKVHDVAKTRNALFVPVRLHVDIEENKRRIVTQDRKNRLKQIDTEAPARYAKKGVVSVTNPNLLDLEVTKLSATKAAQGIISHTRKCRERSR